MYSKGHEIILQAAFDALGPAAVGQLLGMCRPCHEAWRADDRRALGKRHLLDGLMYPDFPCGKVDVDKDNSLQENLETCNFIKFVLGQYLSPYSMGYQSHQGFYALWHAMTLDPNKSVSNTAKNITEYVLIACKLAFEQKKLFWLGFALHIVMDAYSPAHVLRASSRMTDVADERLAAWIQVYDTDLPKDQADNIVRLRNMVRDIVHSYSTAHMSPGEIINSYPKRVRRQAAFVLFDHMQRLALPKRLLDASERPTPLDKAILKARYRDQHTRHPIMNFYHYPQQGAIFHASNDRLSRVRDTELYDDCVRDTASMLQLFLTFARKQTTVTSGHETVLLRRYLFEVSDLLAKRTLSIHGGCYDAETGFDIVPVRRPTYRTHLLVRTPTQTPSRREHTTQNRTNIPNIPNMTQMTSPTNPQFALARDSAGDMARRWARKLCAVWVEPSIFLVPIICDHLTDPKIVLTPMSFKLVWSQAAASSESMHAQEAPPFASFLELSYAELAKKVPAGFPSEIKLLDRGKSVFAVFNVQTSSHQSNVYQQNVGHLRRKNVSGYVMNQSVGR